MITGNAELRLRIYRAIGIALSPLLIFGLFIAYQFVFNLPQAISAETLLEAEISLIPQYPFATFVETLSFHKTSFAVAENRYQIKDNFDNVKDFYVQEFGKMGWIYVNEKKILDWGRDFGEKAVYFCNDKNQIAELQFAGLNGASRGWNYSIRFEWNLRDCTSNTQSGIQKLPFADAIFLFSWGISLLLSEKVSRQVFRYVRERMTNLSAEQSFKLDEISGKNSKNSTGMILTSLLPLLFGGYSIWLYFLDLFR